jgi:hypothetical protein
MAEIQFADGKSMIDDIYVAPIMEATNGAPERFLRKEALRMIGRFVERNHIRAFQRDFIRSHFGRWTR